MVPDMWKECSVYKTLYEEFGWTTDDSSSPWDIDMYMYNRPRKSIEAESKKKDKSRSL